MFLIFSIFSHISASLLTFPSPNRLLSTQLSNLAALLSHFLFSVAVIHADTFPFL